MGKDVKMDDPIKKMKKKLKRVCCCSCVWFWLGVALLIIGIILLVYFGQHISGGDSQWRKNVGYTGIALLVIGLVVTAIGITIAVVLYVIYRRQERAKRGGNTFTPPTFAYGQAPYPQQKPWPQQEGGAPPPDPGYSPGVAPSAPPPGPPPVANDADVKIEVSDHQRY